MTGAAEQVGSADGHPDAMARQIGSMATQLAVGRAAAREADLPACAAPTRLLICGMGGSAMAGLVWRATALPRCTVPVEVLQGRSLPGGISEHTIAVVVSYSGETAETLECARVLIGRGATVIGIGSGGTLASLLERARWPHIRVPGDCQPRAALGYLFGALSEVASRYTTVPQLAGEAAAGLLRTDVTGAINTGLALANRIPLVYANEWLAPIGYRWKTQLNENAKRPAFTHTMPELHHNEVVAFESTCYAPLFHVFFLVAEGDQQGYRNVRAARAVIRQGDTPVTLVEGRGATQTEQAFSLIGYGDWLSYAAAVSAGVNPVEVRSIAVVKQLLRFDCGEPVACPL